MELVNGRNYFNEQSLKEMTERLEAGATIGIYIDCIGHTRSVIEQANYEEALVDKYGDRLEIDIKSDFTTTYRLKEKAQ